MAAVPIVIVDDIVQNMIFQTEVHPELGSLVTILNAYRVANIITLAETMTTPEINDALKKYTGCVVGTGTDLNCYPMGYSTALLFDLSGNPLP